MRDDTHREWGMDALGRSPIGGGRIARLDVLDGYMVAEGDPISAGRDVGTGAGQNVGKVRELIVDTDAMKARYLDVQLPDG